MSMLKNKLAQAIYMAFPLSIAIASSATHGQTASSTGSTTTDTSTTTSTDKTKPKTTALETVTVTGSLISRVDAETASPVIVMDRATIDDSGKQTLGDLLQSLPGISGAATNPAVNNGGGNGASTISLRGLGSKRTLILIDGHRVVNNDVNAIPSNMIERIETLEVGASAIYGSDAIGGVVNIILRKNFSGVQVSSNYGISGHNDGQRSGGNITWGQTWDRGTLVVGLDYNKQDEISSANRNWSKDSLYLSSGSVYAAGSSRNPNGYIKLPSATLASYGCSSSGALTRKSDGSYGCYTSADAYNYQAVNLIETPQQRMNAFALGTFKVTDNITAYADLYHNRTMSSSALAALPFDAQSDGVTIPATNQYNTFGVEFGPDGYEYRTRFTSVGQRIYNYDTTTDQDIVGLKGQFGGSSWSWDANYNYGHTLSKTWEDGLIDYTALQAALDANTTGLDLFDQSSATTQAWLKAHEVYPSETDSYFSKQWQVGASGELWTLPAGSVELAVGGLYRKETENYAVSSDAVLNSSYTCGVATSACASPMQGGFNVKEAYAQVFVPILDHQPGIGSLNVNLSDRYSDYSSVGHTTNATLQVEWRPFDDLLIRGTEAQVFRAPTISELYQGETESSPNFTDPCIGYSGSGHANACSGVSTGWTGSGLSQTNAIVSGSVAAGITLKPERGKSFDYGFVYSPSWFSGFSMNADYYEVTLSDTITTISAQTVANICYQNDASSYCSLIHRYAAGTASAGNIEYIETPTVNLGNTVTSGVDVGFNYKFPVTSWGTFAAALNTTYIQKYNVDPDPGASGDTVIHLAGTYNSSYGNFARLRSRGTLDWHLGNWDTQWTTRWIGPINVGSAEVAEDLSADAASANVVNRYGGYVYHSIAIGYNWPQGHMHIDVGADNIFDKQPPLLYQNNVINANTDVNTYDTIGRYYWARLTYNF
jgi:iron complex outermembrane recepter protein